MRRVSYLLVIVLLAAGAVIWLYRSPHAAVPSRSIIASPPDVAAKGKTFDSGTVVASRGWPQKVIASMSLYARYQTAVDLFPLVQELRERARNGDPDAIALEDDIRSECFSYMLSRQNAESLPQWNEQRNPKSKPGIEAALARRTVRCGRFTHGDLLPRDQLMTLLAVAAAKGSATARAKLLVQTADLGQVQDASLVSAVNSAVDSGDPAAINAISPLMGERVQGRENLFDLPSGTEESSWAWVGAACQIGADCGPHSQILENVCLSIGRCGYSSVDALVRDSILTPWAYRQMLQDEQKILTRIQK